MSRVEKFQNEVAFKYQIFNSLFLTLPFEDIGNTGTLLPILLKECKDGYSRKENPGAIVDAFFEKHTDRLDEKERIELLFAFIKYIERQVVLFDAVEDSAFEEVNDMDGPGTISYTVSRALDSDKKEALLKKLEDFRVRIVLTAHPTQFYPSRVLGIVNDLKAAITSNGIPQVNELLRQLGKTPFLSREKPTPYDEATRLIWYLENVLYHAAGRIQERLRNELKIVNTEDLLDNSLIDIGFWPCGDRDGNPYVNSETTLQVANDLKQTIFVCYYRDIKNLRRRLTYGGLEKPLDKIFTYLSRTIFNKRGKRYERKEELLTDLYEIRRLIHDNHQGFYVRLVDDLISKVKLFGFHFAILDIRQDSGMHDETVKQVLDKLWAGKLKGQVKGSISKNFYELPEQEQIQQLLKLEGEIDPSQFKDDIVRDTLESLYAMKQIQDANGQEGCHRYIISHSEKSLHVMQIYALARICGWKKGEMTLDIVPLFETMDDLKHSKAITESLYAIPEYRAHLKFRGDKQTLMLGFSDGTKDGGYLAANWGIFQAKESLTEAGRNNDVKVVFFDGRGGPPARGGGNTNKFYSSLGSKISDQEIQLTIQGQTISSNFGALSSAQYNLEQLLSAGIENEIYKGEITDLSSKQRKIIEKLAKIGFDEYTRFKESPTFLDYLENQTVLKYYGQTNIGSRPSKRNKEKKLSLDDLRAIPFVGSWAQMKQNVPGFFGLGTAIKSYKDAGKIDEIKELYNKSLFFKTLVENCMQSLCKTYFPLTAYLEKDKKYGEIWSWIYQEYQTTRELLLEISGQTKLLETNPTIRKSIKLREEIILPLITIQQYALMRVNKAKDEGGMDEDLFMTYEKMVVRAFFGSINASRNSV